MSLSPDALEVIWTDLAGSLPSDRQFRSRRLDPALALDAHAGLRTLDGAPCILVDLPDSLVADNEFEVGGMRLYKTAAPGGAILVLSLEETSRRDLFAKLCADVVNAAAAASGPAALALFLQRLEAWRLFLREVRPAFSRAELVGLMGELHVLMALLERDAGLLTAWRAPDGGLHDFEWRGHAIEVKASLGPSPQIRISRLDQLDDTGFARLDLLHLRLFEDPVGITLSELIAGIQTQLPAEAHRRDFQNALLRRGLPPGEEAAPAPLRMSLDSMMDWCVSEGFPRLTRNTVPAAVAEAEYVLDPRSLTAYSVDPVEALTLFAGVDVDG